VPPGKAKFDRMKKFSADRKRKAQTLTALEIERTALPIIVDNGRSYW
jgi:hypothetical protein